MLTPEYLQSVPDAMVELYARAETDILADMARRISGYDMFIPAAQHQLEMLEEMGALRSDILAELGKLTSKSQKELATIMREAGMETLAADERLYKAAGVTSSPAAASAAVKEALAAGMKKTGGLFTNLTKTTANTAAKQFERALDRAYMNTTSGAFDPATAVKRALKELAKQGVGSIEYPSGHVDSIEVAVRRATVTGVNQTAMQMQAARADEAGVDLVETTAHAGARPSHAQWQGKIFSRSGKSRKYPDFVQSTGYGTGAGLGGWNCSHSFRPYIEGFPRAYPNALLKEYAGQGRTYNGHKMTEYEALQQQREIERKIRRWKREAATMKVAGLDATESAVKLKRWQDKETDFLSQTGLKRQQERAQIAGWGRSQAAQASAVATAARKNAAALFPSESGKDSMKRYLKEKPVIDILSSHGIQYRQRISTKEIIVDAGAPKIARMTGHATTNLETKADRTDMTTERAQAFVDNARLTLYQRDRGNLKFLAEDGYAILNLDHALV
ncbi:MAG: phage minor capsid protein, partial [Oscillospiraceae bacterium]